MNPNYILENAEALADLQGEFYESWFDDNGSPVNPDKYGQVQDVITKIKDLCQDIENDLNLEW